MHHDPQDYFCKAEIVEIDISYSHDQNIPTSYQAIRVFALNYVVDEEQS